MRVRSHLLKYQRPEQSGFTPGKSTADRILALRVLVERQREFRQGMLAAYVVCKKAFDLVHSEALWDLLCHRGIPAGIIGLLSDRTENAVKCVAAAGDGRGRDEWRVQLLFCASPELASEGWRGYAPLTVCLQ